VRNQRCIADAPHSHVHASFNFVPSMGSLPCGKKSGVTNESFLSYNQIAILVSDKYVERHDRYEGTAQKRVCPSSPSNSFCLSAWAAPRSLPIVKLQLATAITTIHFDFVSSLP
jgi:hypothetical protein